MAYSPQGYPGLIWRPGAARNGVDVLESAELPRHWKKLDAFEGADYRRIVVPVGGMTGEDSLRLPTDAHLMKP